MDKNIVQLNKLEYLEIDNLCNESIIENIYGISSLKELIISGKKLTKVPEGISKLSKLERFKISTSPINELPKDFNLLTIKYFGYTNLGLANFNVSEEDICYPKWEQIFSTLSEIRTLHEVGLINNQIRILPKAIGLLKQINRLDLSNNGLLTEEAFPKEIKELKNLKELKIVPNAIKLNIISELKNEINGIKIIS